MEFQKSFSICLSMTSKSRGSMTYIPGSLLSYFSAVDMGRQQWLLFADSGHLLFFSFRTIRKRISGLTKLNHVFPIVDKDVRFPFSDVIWLSGVWRDKQNLSAFLKPSFLRTWWLHEHGSREDVCRAWDSRQADPVAHHTNEKTKGN